MKGFLILIMLTVGLIGNVYSQTRSERKNSIKPSQEEMLISKEKQTWTFLKQKDFKGFVSLMAEDFYGIFPGIGNVTKPKLLELVNGFEMKDFQFGDFKVTMLNKDAAIITYEVDEHVVFKGKEFLNHNVITSGWAKRSGRWLQVFFRPITLKSSAV